MALGSRLVAEYNNVSTPTKRYRYTESSFAPVGYSEGGNDYTVHSDYLDTPKVLTDTSGNVVWNTVLSPYGTTLENTDPDGDGQAVAFNLRFPGQYHDRETGLYYNWNRNYDPESGRYIQSDPVGLLGGLNAYAYADLNPLTYTDPSGLVVCGGACIAGGAIAVARVAQVGYRAYRAYRATQVVQNAVASSRYYNEADSDEGASCPVDLPGQIPDFDFNDPESSPVGSDGQEWPWKGQLPQGGSKGGYKNPNGPQSIHPDLDHGGDIGPHWDFNDRKGPGYRIGPDGTITPK